MSSAQLIPSYFGAPERQLFGCYIGSSTGRQRSSAIVICQPFGHEYINSHRAMRQLAVRLSALGFPALRFDYFGCGDSAGDAAECEISECLRDISHGISEVKRRTGLHNVCLVGLRLGATLSLLTAALRSDVTTAVLWDPIVNGKEHLEKLIAFNRELLRFRPKPLKQNAFEWPKDIIGFPVDRNLYEGINQIDLLATRPQAIHNLLIIETANNPAAVALKNALASMGATVMLQHIEAPQIWVPTVDGGLQVPMELLQFIAHWLDRACP